jgi:D-threonate/D-erythronate kinase
VFSDSASAVIADDLTGAAEIGGTAYRHGISAEIHIDRPSRIPDRLIIIDTDTRCRHAREAVEIVERAARELGVRHSGRSVFKKVDSLLRGNVAAETAALLRVSGASRVLLVPANPALGRIIRNGVYFVQGVGLSATEFASDPRHPVSTSRVLELLGRLPGSSIAVASPGQPLPSAGIVVAETTSPADLDTWAVVTRTDDFWAGGAAYFGALLRAEGYSERLLPSPVRRSRRTLLVSGSASQASRAHLKLLARAEVPVIGMPLPLFEADAENPGGRVENWAAEIAETLGRRSRVAISIGHSLMPGEAARLVRHLAETVKEVLCRVAVDHLWVEGGETGSSIVRHLGWKRLRVLGQIAPGVVELQPRPYGPLLTVKPGSYPWPQEATGIDRGSQLDER